MARELQAASSPRMQSAPITIAYGNQETQRFWRDTYRWNQHQNQFDDSDDEEVEEQNHHSEVDEDQMMMMHSGFSGHVIDEDVESATTTISNSSSDEQEKENDVVAAPVEQNTNNAITQQKIGEMSDDLFEQLLAENERKLRQLISYVENVHLVLH